MRKYILCVFILSSAGFVFAAPSISSVSGTPGDGNALTFTGSGFGTQPSSKPTLYADFNGSSNDPNSLGQASSWDVRENMSTTTTSIFEGSHSLGSDTWESTIARIRFDVSMGDSSKNVVALWRRATYTIAAGDNWKWLRLWSGFDGDNFPNWYIGHSPGSFRNMYTEACSVDSHRDGTSGFNDPDTDWSLDEFIFKIESTDTTLDAEIYIYQDGDLNVSSNTWGFNCAGQSGEIDEISIQDDPSNFTPTGDVYYDLIYIDTGTWARVYLSTQSTLSSARRFLQPYSAWATGSITITQEWGDVGGGETMYAYVCDNNNVCSGSFDIVLGGGGDPTPTEICPCY